MCAEHNHNNRGLLNSVLANRCPRCREGKLFSQPNPYNFSKMMDMPEHCPVCGQKFELQTGFYFGTGYVGYALSVLFSVATVIIWSLTLGISIKDNSIFWWLGVNAALLLLLQPVLQRLSRSIWIAFFVRYDSNAGHNEMIGQ